jgi:hypothetical protein
MAFEVSPSLAEIRQSVAIRINMGKQAKTSTALHDLLDEHIRSAYELLVREAWWVILDVSVAVPLDLDNHFYDPPDAVEIGSIHLITVIDTNKREIPLTRGINAAERSAFRVDKDGNTTPGVNSSLPLRWEILDQKLAIYPAPDITQYTDLIVYARAKPRAPYKSGDIVLLDKEALVATATVSLKSHFKIPGMDTDAAKLASHIRNVRAAQSEAEAIQIGPNPSLRFTGNGQGLSDREIFYPDFDPFHPYFDTGIY